MAADISYQRLFLVVCSSLLVALAATAQEDDKPAWQEALEGALLEAVEGSGDGFVGSIRDIEVAHRSADAVELEVALRQVGEPGRVAFTAEVYDEQLRVLDPMEISWDEPPAGDGSTVVRLQYAGAGEVRSVGAKLSLVDGDTGRVSSRRKVALPWQWRGGGEGTSGRTGTDTIDGANLSTRSEGAGSAARETVVVDLDPIRIGTTPKPEEIRIVTGVTLQPATERQTASTSQSGQKPPPSGNSKPAVATTMVSANLLHLGTTVDLYTAAAKAEWRSNRGSLPFNGPTNDQRGFVRQLGTARMVDGKSYKDVLETHPAWVDDGTISGTYRVTVPAGATRFEATVGFLHGVTRSDGVTATVVLKQGSKGTTVARRRVLPKEGLVTISGDIPVAVRGKEVTLVLTVDAEGTSAQDWFAWVAPVIR
ncbi:MAG TPA: hypothetical protein VLB51_05240 [Methylomirabilota bacterium]|nr:hypothetical protein [Methylomirabilota bacterium]